MEAWVYVAAMFGGGASGAAIIKLIDNIVQHKMDRAAKKEDNEADEAAADHTQIGNDISGLKERSKRDYERLNRHDAAIDNVVSTNQALLKAVNALLLHGMTGNASGKMADAQKELMDHIIDKGAK